MNIQEAAKFIKNGYRVRRPSWKDKVYLYYFINISKTFHAEHWQIDDGHLTHHKYISIDDLYILTIDELLADDWEVILSNIKESPDGKIKYE